jgi:hypothetical protein
MRSRGRITREEPMAKKKKASKKKAAAAQKMRGAAPENKAR